MVAVTAFRGPSGTTSSSRYSMELWHLRDLRSLACLSERAVAPYNIALGQFLPIDEDRG